MPRLPATRSRLSNDPDIRAALLDRLSKRFPAEQENLILQEFNCDTARIDVAVVNGALHGYEIKSDQDTLDRLKNQCESYNQVFDRMTLVVGANRWRRGLDELPPWWSVMIASFAGDQMQLRLVKRGKKNPSVSATSLARMLWSSEAAALLRRRGFSVPNHFRAEDIWSAVVKQVPLDELALAVREAFRARAAAKAAKPCTPRDDSYTKESSAPALRHWENRRWLAQQFADRHS